MSLFGLDELAKRLEMEYYADNLPVNIDKIITAYQDRHAALERTRETLKSRMKVLQASLHAASVTTRIIVRDSALTDWYVQGKLQAPRDTWVNALCSIDVDPSWEEIRDQ